MTLLSCKPPNSCFVIKFIIVTTEDWTIGLLPPGGLWFGNMPRGKLFPHHARETRDPSLDTFLPQFIFFIFFAWAATVKLTWAVGGGAWKGVALGGGRSRGAVRNVNVSFSCGLCKLLQFQWLAVCELWKQMRVNYLKGPVELLKWKLLKSVSIWHKPNIRWRHWSQMNVWPL